MGFGRGGIKVWVFDFSFEFFYNIKLLFLDDGDIVFGDGFILVRILGYF